VPEPFILRAEQRIPYGLDEVFDFFSCAENLWQITPPWLNFRIRSVQPNPVVQGTLIRYDLRWHVFPFGWTSRIEVWERPYRFVDLQRRGPFALWHHEHRFQAIPGGTLMSDEIRYRLPFGPLEKLAYGLRIGRDVQSGLTYRHLAAERIFGCWPVT
jgi:hypothetical protein